MTVIARIQLSPGQGHLGSVSSVCKLSLALCLFRWGEGADKHHHNQDLPSMTYIHFLISHHIVFKLNTDLLYLTPHSLQEAAAACSGGNQPAAAASKTYLDFKDFSLCYLGVFILFKNCLPPFLSFPPWFQNNPYYLKQLYTQPIPRLLFCSAHPTQYTHRHTYTYMHTHAHTQIISQEDTV